MSVLRAPTLRGGCCGGRIFLSRKQRHKEEREERQHQEAKTRLTQVALDYNNSSFPFRDTECYSNQEHIIPEPSSAVGPLVDGTVRAELLDSTPSIDTESVSRLSLLLFDDAFVV